MDGLHYTQGDTMNDTTQAGHAMNKAYDITMGYNVPLGLIQRIADALAAAQERIKLLEANDDPEALAISYDKGYSDARDRFKARIAELEAQLAAHPNNVPLYSNEQIDDIVDNHIFLDNGTSTYRVWEDRANKYLREMRDKYEKEIAFWQNYGVNKNLGLLEAEQQLAAHPDAGEWTKIEGDIEGDDTLYVQNGQLYAVTEYGEINIEFPAGYAVCRKQEGDADQ
jgi:hypothetical protein